MCTIASASEKSKFIAIIASINYAWENLQKTRVKEEKKRLCRPDEDNILDLSTVHEFERFLRDKLDKAKHGRHNLLLANIAVSIACNNFCRPCSITTITLEEWESIRLTSTGQTIVVDGQKASCTNFPYISISDDISNMMRLYIEKYRPKPKSASVGTRFFLRYF